MTINTGRFELVLSQKLGAINSGTSNLDLLAHAQVIQQLQSGTVSVVSTFGSLPSAAANVGRLYFVQDSEDVYWSNSEYGWLPIMTRTLNTLWTWGENASGVLGDGSVTNRSSPGTTSGAGSTWCTVSASMGFHTAAIKTDGTAWTWGSNTQGRLGDGTTTNRSSPGTLAGGGTTWCDISTGYKHTAAVKTDGTLWTWALNNFGQLGDPTVVIRSSPGTTAGGGTNWCQASSGDYHTAAVKTDGTLWTWGRNTQGRLGDGTIIDRSSPGTTAGGGTIWCAVNVSPLVSAAMKTDGTLWSWGYNNTGTLGDGTTISRSSPVTTQGGGTTWCQVEAGSRHISAVKTDGTAWTWGCNTSGALGDGAVANKSSPGTTAGGGTTWCGISASNHTAAVKTDGTAWTWGPNGQGRLGDDTVINRSSPVTVVGGSMTWCQVSAGASQTAAIQSKTL